MGGIFWPVEWDIVLFFPNIEPLPDFAVCLDASVVIGYRAFIDNEWFNGRWSPLQLPLSIAYKELLPCCFGCPCLGPSQPYSVSC